MSFTLCSFWILHGVPAETWVYSFFIFVCVFAQLYVTRSSRPKKWILEHPRSSPKQAARKSSLVSKIGF